MFLKVKNESFLFVLCFVIDVLITFQFNYIKLSQNFILNSNRFLSAGKFKNNRPDSPDCIAVVGQIKLSLTGSEQIIETKRSEVLTQNRFIRMTSH